MAHILKSMVGETSTYSGGTGPLTLAAAIQEGGVTTHKRFSAVCSVSDTTEVMVRHDTDGSWAHCFATYSAANELTLTTTVESSTGSPITWAAGGLTVFLTPLSTRVGAVPRGGSTSQVLRKTSGTDFDSDWATIPADNALCLMVSKGNFLP